jgi:hypothetical protein
MKAVLLQIGLRRAMAQVVGHRPLSAEVSV